MARSYLFVMWAGGGNVNPFLGLAEALQGAGHRVGAVATRNLGPRLEEAGFEVVATSEGWLPGADDVRSAVDGFAADALVVDYMLTHGLCGAETSGVPTVALVHTLYRQLLLDGSPNPIGMAGSVEMVNETRAELGIQPIDRHGDLLDACARVLVTAPRELDEPGEVPANVFYTGALFEGPGPDAGWRPPEGDGPVVIVTTGTAGDDPETEIDLLRRIIGALEGLPVRCVVTVPDHIDPVRLESPDNVTVSGYVRHSAVLSHADLLVAHAGLGSVVAALAHGVPMVCLPGAREQPDNADAVVRIGAGRRLDPRSDVASIRTAVAAVLENPRHITMPADPAGALAMLDDLAAP